MMMIDTAAGAMMTRVTAGYGTVLRRGGGGLGGRQEVEAEDTRSKTMILVLIFAPGESLDTTARSPCWLGREHTDIVFRAAFFWTKFRPA
jgi:hypothetical protein